MYIDTHCHLNFSDYQDDASTLIRDTLAQNTEMIIVGSNYETSRRSLQLADASPRGVYAAIGLHPIHLQEETKQNQTISAEEYQVKNYQSLLDNSDRAVAVGEIGLDYFHLNGPKSGWAKQKEKQQQVFIRQLRLARDNKLPVIIHCREAHEDLYRILKDFSIKNPSNENWGVIHCFSGDYELAKKYIDLGLLISFTGLITFVNQWDEVITKIPLEKILSETDSPYLTPVPYRGRRNQPVYVREVVNRISCLKKQAVEEVAKITYNSAKNLFKLD